MHARSTLGVSLGLALGLVTSAGRAGEALHRIVPAGGGLDALDVRVDPAAGVVRVGRCTTSDCRGQSVTRDVTIAIERARIDAANVTIEIVPVGDGRSLARVRVPDVERKDLAFEVLASSQSETPIFAGLTGFSQGSEGDRSGDVVLVYDRDAQSKFVIVAEAREDARICGQITTPLGARGVDPKTMQLRGATLHRIDKKARDAAQRVVAQRRASTAAPLARVLVATGGSAPSPSRLTDGALETAWSEQRPGDGHGEFVTMRAPQELPIEALIITIAPTKPKAEGAAPRTFFVATDDRLVQVTMPEDAWSLPKQAYDVRLPGPVRTTCLAVVLDDAYTRNADAPEVSIAEVSVVTTFDVEGATLDDVARALSSPRSEEAAALLRRAGDAGLAAVATAYDALDPGGRALAVDVASSAGSCEGPAADLLTKALADDDGDVRKRALGRLERCGKAAGPALVTAVRSEDERKRSAAAKLLASVAKSMALEPLAAQMGKGAPATRLAVRSAFARAAAGATRDALLGLLTARDATLAARLDLLRAMGAKLPELRPEADVAIADLLRAPSDMRARYLLAQPLAHLARSPGATTGELSRLAALARRDPETAVRAHAVELSSGIAALSSTIVAAASDPEPRVRDAALKAIATSSLDAGLEAAALALAKDDWTFVRVAAADALGALSRGPAATNALVRGLEDKSAKVRAASVASLGQQRATGEANLIRERLDDAREDPEVRVLAAKTLGAMCVQDASNHLTELARRLSEPAFETDERLGMAAVEALGALHPPDLAERLAPLRAKGARTLVRRAAERAMSEPSACR